MLQQPMTIFMLLKTHPAWLQKNRTERAEIAGAAFNAALADGHITYRHFDAEAFSARCTDIAIFETSDLKAYYFAIERLRDTPIFTHPYFEIIDIIPAFENGYLAFEAEHADLSKDQRQEVSHAL